MSRIGKKPILIPEGVTVTLEPDDEQATVKGKLGTLTVPVPPEISVTERDGALYLAIAQRTRRSGALWGLTRSLLANAIQGVVDGYRKTLIIEGIGYKVQHKGDTLIFALGYSHDIELVTPKGITFVVEKNTITVSGFDKQLVGNTAAKIRAFRKPEPYKGKGIRYDGEVIRRKAGKKAVAAA